MQSDPLNIRKYDKTWLFKTLSDSIWTKEAKLCFQKATKATILIIRVIIQFIIRNSGRSDVKQSTSQ